MLASPIVACANGWIGASDVVVRPDTVPAMVGAVGGEPAGSLSITLVVLLTVGVPLALLRSRSVNVVVEVVFCAPAVGVKMSASSSLVIAPAVPDSV